MGAGAVTLIAPPMAAPAGIELVGPRYFGYNTGYRRYYGR